MTIRVIRVLEYSFPDLEAAEAHFANSFVPTNGVRVVTGNKVKPMSIRSATTWPEQVDDNESDETLRKIEELKRLTEKARQEREAAPGKWVIPSELTDEQVSHLSTTFGKGGIPSLHRTIESRDPEYPHGVEG